MTIPLGNFEIGVLLSWNRILITAAINILFFLLLRRGILNDRRLEGLVVYLEYLGSIVIGLSVIPSAGISFGEGRPLVQLFDPWYGILMINIAFLIKILLYHSKEDTVRASESTGRRPVPQSPHIGRMESMSLLHKKCVPCEGGAKPLTRDQAEELQKQTPEWKLSDDGKNISRTFKFKNFKATRAFFNQVADIADAENHHPDFEVHFGSCTLTLWTHAIGGLSENDFIVAAKVDTLQQE